MFGFALQSSAVGERRSRAVPRRQPLSRVLDPYAQSGIEPTVEDLINDPITRAVMKRDNVTPVALRALVARVRSALQERQAAAQAPVGH